MAVFLSSLKHTLRQQWSVSSPPPPPPPPLPPPPPSLPPLILSHLSLSIQPPLADQCLKPVSPFPEDSAREIAAHLTIYDWNLFSNTQQMEIIYRVFGRHKFGKIVTNLDLLLRRFTEVRMDHVICHVTDDVIMIGAILGSDYNVL